MWDIVLKCSFEVLFGYSMQFLLITIKTTVPPKTYAEKFSPYSPWDLSEAVGLEDELLEFSESAYPVGNGIQLILLKV